VFAALAREQAWLSGLKIDAGAWLLGNANFQHFQNQANDQQDEELEEATKGLEL
jgi:hypothetical protein